jgi:hypothetical protein
MQRVRGVGCRKKKYIGLDGAKYLILREAPYPLPPSATMVGVSHTIFWRKNHD